VKDAPHFSRLSNSKEKVGRMFKVRSITRQGDRPQNLTSPTRCRHLPLICQPEIRISIKGWRKQHSRSRPPPSTSTTTTHYLLFTMVKPIEPEFQQVLGFFWLFFLRCTHRSLGFRRINHQLATILGRQPPVQKSSRDRPGP